LHQLLQGVLKHLVVWLTTAFGSAEIDARCRRIPPNHHIHIFAKGISGLSRITGKEHKYISRLILGLMFDLPLPNGQISPCLVTVVCALLDFLFLAQFPSHTSGTITRLEASLMRFHNNKDIFLDLGIHENFNLPKIHSMIHYAPSIHLFGTTDGYNTEQTEWLHCLLAKDTFHASNCKDTCHGLTSYGLIKHQRYYKVSEFGTLTIWL
ncbi:hypothetical protein EI94DRAFT_1593645, partial [Lactarius quietus]